MREAILAAAYLASCSGCGLLLARRWFGGLDFPLRAMGAVILLAALTIVPFQAVAMLEILGVLQDIEPAVLAGTGITLLAVMLVSGRGGSLDAGPRGGREPLPFWVRLALLMVGSAYLAGLAGLLSAYPDGWDALHYHFPLSVRWWQERSLRITPGESWQMSLPGNAEIGMSLLIPFGWQPLLAAVQWVALWVLGCAVWQLSFRMARDRVASALAVLAALSVPITYYQAFSGYIDVFATSFLAAGAALMFGRHSPLDSGMEKRIAFTAALAGGIAMGSKPVFWLYGALFFLAACALGWRCDRRRAAGFAVLLLAGLMLPSGFWFLRALHVTGNPVYPMQVKLGDRVWLAGFSQSEITPLDYEFEFVRSKAEWLVYPWVEWKRSPGYLLQNYGVGGALGGVFATFVPPGLGYALWLAIRRRREKDGRELVRWLAAWLVLLVCWVFLLRRLPRFGYPLIVLSVALSAPLVSLLARCARRRFAWLTIALFGVNSLLLALAPLYAIASNAKSRTWSRAAIYGYPPLLDRLPPGSVIVNASGAAYVNNFALAGRRLSNRVVADFECPAPLTADCLDRRRADFVAQVREQDAANPSPTAPPVPGLSLETESSTTLADRNTVRVWRIWRVPKAPALRS